MKSFNAGKEGVPESIETLQGRASALVAKINELTELSKKSGENIDVELGSEEYVDHGYLAEAREMQVALDEINTKLSDIDDQRAAQRNLL